MADCSFPTQQSLENITSNYLILPTRARHVSSCGSDLIIEGVQAETKLAGVQTENQRQMRQKSPTLSPNSLPGIEPF